MENDNSKHLVLKKYAFDEMRYRIFMVSYYTILILIWLVVVSLWGVNSFAVAYTVIIIYSAINHYRKSKRKLQDNTVRFISVDGLLQAQISNIKWRSDKNYVINKVYNLKQNRFFIMVIGDISVTKSRFYRGVSSTYKRKRMLIPSYFEDMYEIYRFLNRMKAELNGNG